MPIDPNIALSVRPIEIPSPIQTIGSLMQMRGAMAQLAHNQALAEQERQNTLRLQAETEKQNRDLSDQNTVQELSKDPANAKAFGAGDFTSLNGKVQPGTLNKLTEAHATLRDKLATTHQHELDNMGKEHGIIERAINGLKSLGDDGAIATEAPQAFARLQAQGVIPPNTPMPQITGAKDLDRYAAQNAWLQGAIEGALKTKKAQQDLSAPYEKTVTTDEGIMGFNPETKAYDRMIGQPPEKKTNAAPTITTDEGIMQWNPESQRYDIQAGTAASKGDKNPTETTLALAVAAGKAAGATPEQVTEGTRAELALKRLDQSKRESRPVTNINMTPAQADATAAGIAHGQISDPATIRAMLRRQPGLMAEVLKIDPGFDETQLDKRSQTLREFTNTSNTKAGGQAIALNTLIHHADLYLDTAEALKNGSFVPGNAVYNRVASAFGSAPPTNAAMVARFLAGETGKVATGGVPAEGEINGILNNLSTSASPDQIAQSGKTLLQIASGRATPLMERVKDSKLESVVHVLGPDAQAILAKRGFNPQTMKAESGQNIANPKTKAEYDALPAGTIYMKDGQMKRKR